LNFEIYNLILIKTMYDEKCSEPLIFKFCILLLPGTSERLRLSDMFNFEMKKYIPYIAVTMILLITMIPIKKLRDLRKLIFIALMVFNLIIFPCIFFYMMEGLSVITIILIVVNCLTIIILVTSLIYKKALIFILAVISLGLIGIFVFIIVLLFKTEGMSNTVIFLITLIGIVMMMLTFFCTNLPDNIKFSIAVVILLSLFGLYIYTIVMVIKSLKFKFQIQFNFNVYLFINFVVGILINILYHVRTVVSVVCGIIISFLTGGINFYIIYYVSMNVVNPVSLLLFWTNLWFILFGIYTTIEYYIAKNVVPENEIETGGIFGIEVRIN
jgi:hypothetical protein